MKIKVMFKVKETDSKRAKEYLTHAINKLMCAYEFHHPETNKIQSWGFPKEFKKWSAPLSLNTARKRAPLSRVSSADGLVQ